MVLNCLAFIKMLRTMVMACKIHRDLGCLKHGLQSLHQIRSGTVLTNAPHWKVARDYEVFCGGSSERGVD
eukprot:CAMPEP_0115541688 /NCGR_PEP_ID=MMETSP0271-20121206/90601_1 /TAXON_ID=71861 /ORGANISM="Scrippsiella trochoidea, Strain CCMP3099" /LENGTH=69 /DNA_ID=CAMNT_0002974779 /DNA_START=195 /DNA_END=401 /DNA_ORIENTATION=+